MNPQSFAMGMLAGAFVVALLWWSFTRRPQTAQALAAEHGEAAAREAIKAELLAETHELHAADQRATAKMLRKRAERLRLQAAEDPAAEAKLSSN